MALSQEVLDELTDYSPLGTVMLCRAWGDLSVESKLQVLAARKDGKLPNEVVAAGLDDVCEIVRYKVATHVRRTTGSREEPGERIAKDRSDLVRAALAAYPENVEDLDHMTHLERLVALRALSPLKGAEVFTFVQRLSDAGLTPPNQLEDYVREYCRRAAAEFANGSSALLWNDNNLAIARDWPALARLPPYLAEIACYLHPVQGTSPSDGAMSLDIFRELPGEIQKRLFRRSEEAIDRDIRTAVKGDANGWPSAVVSAAESEFGW